MPVNILGINCGHDASIALVQDNKISFALAEERISRVKHHYGFPKLALECLFNGQGVEPNQIDAVAFSGARVWFPQHRNTKIIDINGEEKGLAPLARFKRQATNILNLNPVYAKFSDYPGRNPEEFYQFLQELDLFRKGMPVYHVAHHLCHASGAARASGMDKATVITLDGKGDGLSSTIFEYKQDGSLKLHRSSRAGDSLGAFYQAVTEALDFTPADGEFKTMGLAAFGTTKSGNPFSKEIRSEDGVLRANEKFEFRKYRPKKAFGKIPNPISGVSQADKYRKLREHHDDAQLAFWAQEQFENIVFELIQSAVSITSIRNVVGAGGAMLNVKANQKILESNLVDELFVFPDAPDSGLSSGAALEVSHRICRRKERFERLLSPYIGHEFSNEFISKKVNELRGSDLTFIELDEMSGAETIAKDLEKGSVLGTFVGRMEFGPRALGNRSVIADPRYKETKERINSLLKGREYFVPFAPIVLEEDADLYWSCNTRHKYMTHAVEATDYAKQVVPVVVHVDGTMRPQVVSRNDNPWLHNLLLEFKKISGVGVLVNTSFNRHGHPICGSPEDAIQHLREKWVDGVVFEQFLLKN